MTKTPDPRIGLTGRTYTTKGRARGSAPWRPQAKTLVLLTHIDAVLAAYAFPITARQVFYRLVGLGVLAKTERAYDNLCNLLVRARRSGRISWEAIADDSLVRYGPIIHDGAPGFLSWADRQADGHLFADWTEGQAVVPIVWTESDGMASFLRGALASHGWPVEVVSTSGSDSVGPKREMAMGAVDQYAKTGQPTVIGKIGDLDEAGLSIIDSLTEDLLAFADNMGQPDAITVEWVALTNDQVVSFGLPTNPGKAAKKARDGRLWTPPGGTMAESVQAEALDPADLTAVVEDWLRGHLDIAELDNMMAVSTRTREAAKRLLWR